MKDVDQGVVAGAEDMAEEENLEAENTGIMIQDILTYKEDLMQTGTGLMAVISIEQEEGIAAMASIEKAVIMEKEEILGILTEEIDLEKDIKSHFS
jgi:hypothetical protein